MARKKLYAVRKGRITGVFDTWEACKEAVEGYPGAQYKSFSTKMEAEGYTEKDSVTGGNGGKQHFVVEGFPYPAYSRKRTLLLVRQQQQIDIKGKIDTQINLIEQCINEIDNSRMRRLITLRYIEGLSWVQVARKMGKHHTADGCRMAVERFLAKI